MKISFKRITSSGSFIPEIDGLRFIAITSVVLYHIESFLNVKIKEQCSGTLIIAFFKKILTHGHLGVPLFFVISGFILGMPFAKFYIIRGEKIDIKKYFLRRLTRLEPPYLFVMTVLFLGAVYIGNIFSFSGGLSTYLASIIYAHTFIFPNTVPILNAVAWSLEVEVQFYILAPLIACVFL